MKVHRNMYFLYYVSMCPTQKKKIKNYINLFISPSQIVLYCILNSSVGFRETIYGKTVLSTNEVVRT